MTVQRKYERDIDILLAEEFSVSPDFAHWFLAQTQKFTGLQASVLDAYVSRTDPSGESDLVVLYESAEDGSRLALLIEDKIDATMQPQQEARYRLRAQADVARGEYADYEVIICCPEAYRESHPETACFDSHISFEEIGAFLKSDPKDARRIYRGDFINSATMRTVNTWIRNDDPTTNAFWKDAYEIATKEFPDLEMTVPKLSKGATWINFRPLEMRTHSRGTYLSFKGDRGFMDLTFTGTMARLFAPMVLPTLESDMTIHQTGKSAAIRIVVDGFGVCQPNEKTASVLRAAFGACVRLIRFHRTHRELLTKSALDATPEIALGAGVP